MLRYLLRGNCLIFSYEVSVRPSIAELIADLIIHKQWGDIIVMHDGGNGLLADF